MRAAPTPLLPLASPSAELDVAVLRSHSEK